MISTVLHTFMLNPDAFNCGMGGERAECSAASNTADNCTQSQCPRLQLHLCGQIVLLSTATQSLAKIWLLQTKQSVLVAEAELQCKSRPKWRHQTFWGVFWWAASLAGLALSVGQRVRPQSHRYIHLDQTIREISINTLIKRVVFLKIYLFLLVDLCL